MSVQIKTTNEGIFLTLSDEPAAPVQRDPDASQTAPRLFYVYAHACPDGKIFYVGKGVRRRAWDKQRHFLWHRYVDTRLGGHYDVLILHDGLTEEDADHLESEWIAQESSTVVNWQNMGRMTDFALLDRFHALRDANRANFAAARPLESTDLAAATAAYVSCIEALASYASIQAERGLVGELLEECNAEFGISGDLGILDRLTLCLCKQGRKDHAADAARRYFESYRRDLALSAAPAILKRCGMQMP